MTAAPLRDVTDAERFGGKAAQLGAALRAGLPVPDGVALSHDLAASVARGDAGDALDALTPRLRGALAVRSSAVGEDGRAHSFAGQHLTLLGVAPHALREAVARVVASGTSAAARAYRQRHGLVDEPRVAVVVQRMVEARCAGVMFTRDPLDGGRVRVIEAAWGLGEAVVQGLVTPDHARLRPDGALVSYAVGHKDLRLARGPDGDVVEHEVPEALARARCLDDAQLGALHALADACERHLGPALDLEWAFEGDALALLQARPITAAARR